ncbi:hypothetical protein CQU01_20170 [Cerasibacillus quisquiliarum]|uniref:Uncharacterized protein n=1 Tax=Cerasibacillus quisquiliarum TaxID=227865 RepID=A0A511UYW7_9BACI|nr:hypothetical protein CQU01_20170 [Cerasibacillus quisquiliarum]
MSNKEIEWNSVNASSHLICKFGIDYFLWLVLSKIICGEYLRVNMYSRSESTQ